MSPVPYWVTLVWLPAAHPAALAMLAEMEAGTALFLTLSRYFSGWL